MDLAVGQDVDGRTVVSVVGELDTEVADRLRDAGLAAATGADGFAMDLSGVDFIDSSGLAALIAINNALQATGSHLTVLRPSRPVRRILEITGLNTAFTVVD